MTTPATRIPVLYIAGAGRSGSTVIERVIASLEGYVAVGETRYAWLRGHQQNELCSCGQRFDRCPFWLAVIDDVFGQPADEAGGGPGGLEAFAAEQDWLIRLRRTPALRATQLRSTDVQDRLTRCFEVQARLYRSFLARSGATVVIDSSKYATYGYLLAANPQLDLRVLHLVRDPRAVAFSWQRIRHRPEASVANQFMTQFAPRSSARIWLMDNFLAGGLRRHAERAALLRYEDFCAGNGALEGTLTDLDFPTGTHRSDNSLSMHSVAGNPGRLEQGPVVVRPDVEWRTGLSRRDRRVVELLVGPALMRYGYLGAGEEQ